MAEAPTPRIVASYLDAFIGSTVRLTGRVLQLRGEVATVDAQGPVTAHLARDSHLTVGHAVELVAKVNPDLSLKVYTATDMGRDLDFAALDAVVDATHRFKAIFYQES